jgi:CrcB protein
MSATFLWQILVVGVGGFLGSAARFLLSGFVHRLLPPTFPYGTLVVNLSGCLAIGYLGGLLQFRSLLGPSQRLFLLIGFLGGFTTFSSFAYETLTLAQGSEFLKAAFNIAAHVMLGLTAAWLGYFSAHNL